MDYVQMHYEHCVFYMDCSPYALWQKSGTWTNMPDQGKEKKAERNPMFFSKATAI